MKRVAFLFAACCALVVSCSSSSGGDESYTLSPSDLQASGATTYASSLSDVLTCLQGVKHDVVMKNLGEKVSSISLAKNIALLSGQSVDSSLLSASALSKVRNAAYRSSLGQGRSVTTASLDLSGEKIGDYFIIEKGVASYKFNLTTSDNDLLNLADSKGSNLTDCSLAGNLALLLKGQNLPATSIFKSIVLNAEGTVTRIGASGVIPKTEDSDGGMKDLVLNGKANVIFGCSINNNGLGGKIILTAQATEDAKIADTTAIKKGDYPSFLPTEDGEVVLTVFDDNNKQVYTEKWDSVTRFALAINALTEED